MATKDGKFSLSMEQRKMLEEAVKENKPLEFIETGNIGLDLALSDGKGLPMGASILLWAKPGSGKTTIVADASKRLISLPFKPDIRRPDRDNTIDVYISDDYDDVLRDGTWELFFTEKPEPFTKEEKKAWLATMSGVSLGSDAFFPFGDNIERAKRSGVQYIAEPGGSIRDDNVIETCNKYGMTMVFTGIRLFHH